jgi:hypothetical protein
MRHFTRYLIAGGITLTSCTSPTDSSRGLEGTQSQPSFFAVGTSQEYYYPDQTVHGYISTTYGGAVSITWSAHKVTVTCTQAGKVKITIALDPDPNDTFWVECHDQGGGY